MNKTTPDWNDWISVCILDHRRLVKEGGQARQLVPVVCPSTALDIVRKKIGGSTYIRPCWVAGDLDLRDRHPSGEGSCIILRLDRSISSLKRDFV